jgi:hypothetical protein
MRSAGKRWAAALGALVACAAAGACSYDFDGLVAHTGTAGIGGSGGSAGEAGSSGAAGSDDGAGGAAGAGAGAAGAGGAATDGSAGTGGAGAGGAGKGGADAGNTDSGKGGDAGPDAGKGGNAGADASSDRASDAIGDVRTEVAFDCTAVGGTVYQSHCYYPSPTTTNWDTANTMGCAAPSHLAVITTAGEQTVVAAILAGKDRWIGLHKDLPPNMESSLRWVTGEALAYKSWDTYDTGPPEPNYTGDCVRMRPTNNWGDTACTELYAAVCERE